MALQAGSYTLGPDDGALMVRTKRAGVAAKAGHDLVIEVTAWQATLELGADPAEASFALDADSTSLRVREANGGMQALGADDLKNIEQTIDDEVLKRCDIEFRSTTIESTTGGLSMRGTLALGGNTAPVSFEVATGPDDALRGTAIITQSDWGIAPYSTLFGTLKVVDEVEVSLEARLPAPAHSA